MGLWSRLKLLFAAKASSAIDKAEDPRQVLDYAYSQQQELLLNLRRGLVDDATSKQQLEREAARIKAGIPRFETLAAPQLPAAETDVDAQLAALERELAPG